MSSSKLITKYLETRNYTEELCKPLAIEDYIPQAAEFVSPVKWHIAHVSWFFEELILKKHLVGYQEFNPQFCFLFNSYYQSVGERAVRFQRGLYTRPTVEQVYLYRQHVDQHMQKLLAHTISSEVKALTVLGINHEQQHQELLLTDLKYTFGLSLLYPQYDTNFMLEADHNITHGWLKCDAKLYDIGHQGDEFCYDNELAPHQVYLEEFEISQTLVTNGEYIDFIEQGGYQKVQLWLDDGWSWVCNEKVSQPLHWHNIDGQWHYFTLAGLKPIDKDALLCHVSFYEANAYATWQGLRLPTEFEWEAASHQLAWGKRWEWTSSAYQPYPRYQINEGAVGEYNGKFMVNTMVLRGASVATSQGHARHTYRNFFTPETQWQFSGIRLVRDQINSGKAHD
ncbi:ergothioneine biosynthesis protein EgtB [Colwellia sp. E2M01]|uniref:ergothioneine biosynthesis protein EgtB n=1 Tax=Colwellia sp. E2M01 TaxID=2841561 RepID=UPI001C0A2C5C|nr:ergothioneine biosynthesis protein EgtB [Colwellia sp. E2M01]MBU2871414.1 ergothioneine biosynthesis protein EgtB [Colwellia sp. E2M01]